MCTGLGAPLKDIMFLSYKVDFAARIEIGFHNSWTGAFLLGTSVKPPAIDEMLGTGDWFDDTILEIQKEGRF